MTPPVATRPELRSSPWVLLLPLALTALAVAGAAGGGSSTREDGSSPLSDLPYAISGLSLYLVVLVLAYVCVRRSPDRRATLGLVRPPRWGTAFGLAIGLVIGGLVLGQALDRLLHASKAQGLNGALEHGAAASIAIAISFAAYAIVGPMVEELVFRGIVTSAIRGRLGAVGTPLASGTLFALAHGDPHIVLALLPLGVALGFVYERTGSIVPGMVTHVLYNAIGLIAVLY